MMNNARLVMTEQEMREAFEKTINIHCRARNEHGDYIMGETQDAWSGFQRGYEVAQQRIEELELANNIAWGYKEDLAGVVAKHNAIIKREALQRAVDICETVEPMPTYKAGGTATCRESDCYDIGIEECKEAIKKEMDGWDETV